MNNHNIPVELQHRVERELEPGEHVAWMERPIPRYLSLTTACLSLFGIPWTAFSVFWIYFASSMFGGAQPVGNTSSSAGPNNDTVTKLVSHTVDGYFKVFPWFGVPFVLIGLGLLASPYWAYRAGLQTVYVITNRRAITFEGGWSKTIRSYPPDRLQDVHRKERRDGTGDVILTRRVWQDSDGHERFQDVGFLRIREPKTVESLLRKLSRGSSA
jgi:hypothetical protein